jgi:hypothetical protein
MEAFYIGLHHECYGWPFRRCMISVNAIARRKSDFKVNEWIMDSGAFGQISRHGKFLMSIKEYCDQIERWHPNAAVAQDWMCEPFILETTSKTVVEHQALTFQSYLALSAAQSRVYILPVLQGFEPLDYVRHIKLYGDTLVENQWVGVGSVCKRNGTPDAIEDVLLAIKQVRPDLRLHGFGLKIQALERASIRALLYSADSMAWSYAGRRQKRSASDPRDALRYAARIETLLDVPVFVQEQLFSWWNNDEETKIVCSAGMREAQ